MRMIGGKLGRVVETPVPVHSSDRVAAQARRPAVRAARGYPVQMLHRGLALCRGQVVPETRQGKTLSVHLHAPTPVPLMAL